METSNPKIMIVTWIDSSVQDHQVDHNDYPKPWTIRSVGWIVEETSTYVTLARDDMEKDEFRGLLCIPKTCIVSHE